MFDENFKIAADYDFLHKCRILNTKIYNGKEVVGFFNSSGISNINKTKALIEKVEIDLSYSKNLVLTLFMSIVRLIWNFNLFKNYNKMKSSFKK